ncbi:hypothetical protein LSH36_687g02025 [Paralvinella palmiformis]|uniref:G-protein coupled receptors family 1 profile domain-containing protein n=1 Tax=Paralvinella palmiformis TaxID=53620 RepID=A0AAD9J291_9ANNE|nr:hypothetical protein LSH36_687g02025 [Paralvinella palmiformis]
MDNSNSSGVPEDNCATSLLDRGIGRNCSSYEEENINLDAGYKVRFIYAAVGSVGILGNAIVIGVIVTSLSMRKATTNILIANQSAIDFSASLFIVLTTYIREVDAVRGVLGKELFCRLWADNFPIWSLFVSSTYNLVCITMERYVGIVHPIRHGRMCTRGRAAYVLSFAWLTGLAYNLSYMVPTSPYKEGHCTAYSEWPSLFVQRAVGLLTIGVQFVLPMILIAFAYARIVVTLRRGGPLSADRRRQNADRVDFRREERMKRARVNVVKTLVLVSLSFVLCWAPNQIYYTMYNLGFGTDFNGTFYHFTVIAVFLNCCINPVIYSFQYEQFKVEMFRFCRRSTEVADVSLPEVTRQARHRKAVYVIKTDRCAGRCNDAFHDEQTHL